MNLPKSFVKAKSRVGGAREDSIRSKETYKANETNGLE